MTMAKSDASRLRKGLPWLKHLQAALNNDDSSDSSSQPTQVTPKKVGKTTVKEEGREAGRRNKKKRLRRDESDSSEDTSSGESDGAKEKKRRQPKKVVKVRRKRSLEEARKKGKSHVESTKAKAAALRGQRMKKLHAMRVTSGEHDRMAAFKLKRQRSAEALKDKERNRMRAIRAARGAQNVSTGVEADVEDEGEPRRRPRLQPAADKDTAAKTVKRRANTSKKSKPKQTDPATLALEKAPDSVKDEADDDSEVKSLALAEGLPSDLGRHDDDDDKTEDLATCATPKTPEGKDGDSSGIIRSTPAGPAKPEDSAGRSSAAKKVKSSERETTESNVKVEPEASEGAKSERGSQDKPEGADADAIKITPSLTSNGTSVEPSRPESEDQVKTEPLVPAEGAAELVKDEIKEEEQTEPSALTALSVKLEDEKKLGEEKLPLHEVPIPRKAPKEGESAVPPSSTGSFVIPKRTFVKSDTAGHKAKPQVKPAANTEATVSDVKRSLKAPGPVTMLPLASPQSSPNWPKDEPTHSQRKRTKNPVPVKRSSFSTQDQALMRLSRNRNSIFMAAAELTAQASDIKSSKTTRMMGYEVYDVDGKTLPDLISRLSCATKREMATDRESYVASFFGVSRTAPKAKRELSSVSGGCGGTDLDPREMNCYEELCFERPEDREFYQRKMYGTAFVPQNLRGWITLIVRNARFERKSTGIRFNQDRDREQFAATLSQRYTFNKSVPRCDIPRENWQNLMRNKPATVYLHYYNREDAERAAQVFRDDLGQPLQIRWELKAGARIRRCSSLATGSRPQLTPRRSCSSEQSAPEPSPLSSHNDSARNTPLWRRERVSSDHRYPRYDRGAPPTQWSRGESRESRHAPSLSGNKRPLELLERRSRSRSKSFHSQHYESSGHVNRAESGAIETSNQHPSVAENRARTDGGNESASSAVHSDVGTPAQKRERMLPRRSPTSSQDRSTREDTKRGGLGGEEYGEVKSSFETAPSNRVENWDGGGNKSGVQRARSPSRRWQKDPSNANSQERRNSFTDNLRDRSTGPQSRFNQQQPRSRSRSRPTTSFPARGGHDGNYGDRNKERRGSREFGQGGGGYNPNASEQHMHSDRGRGGHNGRSGDVNSRAP